MRKISILLLLLASMAPTFGPATATTPVNYLPCVSGSICLDHTGTPGVAVSVGGYASAGDGGGGEFVELSATCSRTGTSSGNVYSGQTVIQNATSLVDVMPGALITGNGIQPGTEVAGASGTNITMTIPANYLAYGNTMLTALAIDDDNGGTLVMDSGTDCYQKTNYRGDPHEWGAVGDANSDDTSALLNWLGAFGVPLSTGNSPTNYGPWIASMPGNYKIKQPLRARRMRIYRLNQI